MARIVPFRRTAAGIAATFIGFGSAAIAAPVQAPRITAVSNDVQLVSVRGHRRAGLNQLVGESEEVRTGKTGRAELVLPEQIIVRLPGNTTFAAHGGIRNLHVGEGAALLETPPSAYDARLCDGSVAVALTGTTVLFEHHPSIYKLLVLEGTARLYRPDQVGDSMLVEPGQMVIANPAGELSDAVDFDTAHFVKTCRLIRDFAPLPTAAAIARESEKQSSAKGNKTLIETNLVIFGSGTAVTLVNSGKVPNRGRAVAGPTPGLPTSTGSANSLGAIDAARGVSR
jgi:hypothetical protein